MGLSDIWLSLIDAITLPATTNVVSMKLAAHQAARNLKQKIQGSDLSDLQLKLQRPEGLASGLDSADSMDPLQQRRKTRKSGVNADFTCTDGGEAINSCPIELGLRLFGTSKD